MRYTWQDTEELVSDVAAYADGEFMIWMRGVWTLIEVQKRNECGSALEQIRFLSLIYGLCKLYQVFCDKLDDTDFDDDIYLDIDYAALTGITDAEELEAVTAYLQELIHDRHHLDMAFALLRTKLNASRVFAALYYARCYERYSLADYESDAYYYGDITDPEELAEEKAANEDYERRKEIASWSDEEIYDDILNDVDVDKCVAFEWISEYM